LVGVLLAGECRSAHSGANLDTLHRINAHQRRREIAVELAVDRRAKAGRDAFRHDLDDGPDGRPTLANAVEIAGVEGRLLGVRAEEWIALNLFPVPARAINLVRAHLDERAAHREARHDLARDRTGGD